EQHQLKTYNYINWQIFFQVATTCKRLLPRSFEILSIFSLHERSQLCTKAALFHIYTCTHINEEP
ncbi:45869_t:CDS:1, partial [Gigaspora margarita]